MNKKLGVIIGIFIFIILGSIYFIPSDNSNKVIDSKTGLPQELLDIANVRAYISDSSGKIDQYLLPFKANNSEFNYDFRTYRGALIPMDNIGNGELSTISYSKNKEYAIEFPTNEHGGADLWFSKNGTVNQLCSHCGIRGSYWMDDHRFVLLEVIVSGRSEDDKYHKTISIYDLVEKTILTYTSVGLENYEMLNL